MFILQWQIRQGFRSGVRLSRAAQVQSYILSIKSQVKSKVLEGRCELSQFWDRCLQCVLLTVFNLNRSGVCRSSWRTARMLSWPGCSRRTPSSETP